MNTPVTNPRLEFDDIAREWKILFYFGLMQALMGLTTMAMDIAVLCFNQKKLQNTSNIVDAVNAVASVLWFLTATCLRFKHGGKVCAADFAPKIDSVTEGYLYSEGRFLKIYTILFWVMIGLAIVVATGVCVKKMRR